MWSDDLTLGIAEIDSQHKALFAQLARLLDACVAGGDRDETLAMLAFLDGYVVSHFASEEQLQEHFGYPDYRQHQAEHRYFREQVVILGRELTSGSPGRDFTLRVNRLLIDWLRSHIRTSDRLATTFLLKEMPRDADNRQ
ncbi:hemerythrin [Geotalea uraniireducens]|uniref:Hemerythrin n=1 Tax=Geotalea uraniireducens TaxID=351604 RepID=A0ABM8ENX4_9BACT|nr:bacteriohemerythrin [Geotalea uraniireducens]BDV44151.1 hemerythrin [Geotalea uraniireducens]